MQRKSKIVAALLALFLGGIGIHRFYLGNYISGLLYLFFCWTFIPSFLALIDFIYLLVISDKRFDELYNKDYLLAVQAMQPQQLSHVVRLNTINGYDGEVGHTTHSRRMAEVREDLEQLNRMRDDGLISDEEYHTQRKRFLNS